MSIFYVFIIVLVVVLVFFGLIIIYREPGHSMYPSESSHYRVKILFILGRMSILLFQHFVEIVNIDLRYSNLPDDLDGLRIVQLSDTHYQKNSHNNILLLSKAVKKINETIKPDLVMITGDILQCFSRKNARRCAKIISKIKSPVFACLGSHDTFGTEEHHIYTRNIVVKIFEETGGMEILNNEYISPKQYPNLKIMGMGAYLRGDCYPDRMKPKTDRKSSSSKATFNLCLSHNPDSRKTIINSKKTFLDIHLLMAGHTHGGQICIPFTKFPLLLVIYNVLSFLRLNYGRVNRIKSVIKDWNYCSGLFSLYKESEELEFLKNKESIRNERYFYVNRGLGSHCNLRFFCRPEITVFRLLKK